VRKNYWFSLLLVGLAAELSNACGDEPRNAVQEQTDARIDDSTARIVPDVREGSEDVSSDAGPNEDADASADRDGEAAADAPSEANDAPDMGPVHEPVIGCAAASLPAGASFEILPLLPTPDGSDSSTFYSWGYGVSADGAVVVGEAEINSDGITHPILWREGKALDLYEPGFAWASAHRANCDGSVVLVSLTWPASDTYRWSSATGLEKLTGDKPRGHRLSADGNVVLGFTAGPDGGPLWLATRWVGQDLSILDSRDAHDVAGLSAAGDVAVMQLWDDDDRHVFRWKVASGSTLLFSAFLGMDTVDLSADGSTVLLNGFRWTDELGMQPLGCSEPCAGRALSSGGRIVALIDNSVWDVKHGYRSLAGLLAEGGASFGDWRMTGISGMSNNGRVFVGSAANASGIRRAFRAILPASAFD
jgi:hypothetical protein